VENFLLLRGFGRINEHVVGGQPAFLRLDHDEGKSILEHQSKSVSKASRLGSVPWKGRDGVGLGPPR